DSGSPQYLPLLRLFAAHSTLLVWKSRFEPSASEAGRSAGVHPALARREVRSRVDGGPSMLKYFAAGFTAALLLFGALGPALPRSASLSSSGIRLTSTPRR